ncbi:MAG: response regulator [Polyangiaceae bacterium]|nr:response regulator [Polyangiaceae bacterium]
MKVEPAAREPARESENIVLIVEDEPVLRATMARSLSKLTDVEVVDAGTVADARALLKALTPRVVILDLHLPDGTGIDLLPDIEQAKLTTAILFVTAYPHRIDQHSNRPGGLTVLEKPIAMNELRRVVADAFSGAGVRTLSESPFCLADYMQLAWLSHRSARIDIRRHGGLLGSVWIKEGHGYHAQDAGGTGNSALGRLLFATGVTTETHPVTTFPLTQTLHGNCEELLLDATRRFDEDSHPPPENEGNAASPSAGQSLLDASWDDPAPATFDDLYAKGVDALLSKAYAEAYQAFSEAAKLGTSPGLETNLNRLRALGFGP